MVEENSDKIDKKKKTFQNSRMENFQMKPIKRPIFLADH